MLLAPLPNPKIILPVRNMPKFWAVAIQTTPTSLIQAESIMAFFRPILFVIGANTIAAGVDPI